MIVAGFGFRAVASEAALEAALNAALQRAGMPVLTAFATAADKADASALCALAQRLGLPITAIDSTNLRLEDVTKVPHIPARYGAQSVAEAAALAAAGPGARLLVGRVASKDGMAMVAIAAGRGA